MPALLISNSH